MPLCKGVNQPISSKKSHCRGMRAFCLPRWKIASEGCLSPHPKLSSLIRSSRLPGQPHWHCSKSLPSPSCPQSPTETTVVTKEGLRDKAGRTEVQGPREAKGAHQPFSPAGCFRSQAASPGKLKAVFVCLWALEQTAPKGQSWSQAAWDWAAYLGGVERKETTAPSYPP